MMRKLTEEQYKDIVICFNTLNNELNADLNLGLMNNNLIHQMKYYLKSDFDFQNDWAVIMAIANPLTGDWAHDQFVEKTKKYRWIHKESFTDENGDTRHLVLRKDEYGALVLEYNYIFSPTPLYEFEIREWGYNPDMFDREEVEC